MKSINNKEFSSFVRKLILNDILVQLSGTVGVFLLYLLLEFYNPSYILELITIELFFVFFVYVIQNFLIVRKLFKNRVSVERFKRGEIREIVSNIKFLYGLPNLFYVYRFILWVIGGVSFGFVLRFYFHENNFFKIISMVFSIVGLSPIAGFVSKVVAKRVASNYISKLLNSLNDELQLNFLPKTVFTMKWFFLNLIYVLFYVIIFFSVVSLSVTTGILRENTKGFIKNYMEDIKETIEGYYYSNVSPDDLDTYLKTLKMADNSKISFIDGKGKVFGYPFPAKISEQDIFLKSKVGELGTLYIYMSFPMLNYFKMILSRGLVFFIIFLLFLGYIYNFQLAKDLEKEFEIVGGNIEKIASKDFSKVKALYSDDQLLKLNLKVLEVKKNFSYLFSRFSHLISEMNVSVNTLLAGFESFSLYSTNQSKQLDSTKSKLFFLNDFVTNITNVTSQLSQIAEEFSHVIVKFVAAINEARNETHNLLKVTDSITTSITEVNVSHVELEEQTQRILQIGSRLNSSIDKVLDFTRNLSIENSEGIKKLLTLEKQNNQNENYLRNTGNSLEKFNNYFKELLNKIDLQGEEINKINQIFKIIEDLIDQTNVLALNASLIAAKSKTEDSGFGVIAESIKDLSERLHLSMSEVGTIISKGVGNFKVLKEIGLNSKKSLASVENFLDKSLKIVEENKKQIESISKSNDIIFVIIEEAKMMLGELVEDLRNIENFLDSISFDFSEQKKAMDKMFDFSIDLKDIVEVIKVSYEQMSDSTSTFSFTYDKMRNLSVDLNESISRFKNRLTEILSLLNSIDSGAKEISDIIIKIEFTLYSMNKAMIALNSIFSTIKLPLSDMENE